LLLRRAPGIGEREIGDALGVRLRCALVLVFVETRQRVK